MTHISKRDLIAGAGAASLFAGTAGAAARPLFDWPLGVQLWSVNAELARDVPGTLRKLRTLGYRRVETAGLHGLAPAAFGRAVAAAGLRCDGAHMSLPDFNADPARRIGEARDMGADWLICASPEPPGPLPAGVDWNVGLARAMTLDAWKRNADMLNAAAVRAKAAGLGFGYHNHLAEFGLYEGRRGFDVLLERTDPRLVRFELDAAWAAAGGQDPAALLRAHRGRFTHLHLKDLKALPPAGTMAESFATTEIGRGAIDWPAVFAAARAAGVIGAYVEQEGPYARPVFQSLAISRDYLLGLRRG